MKNKKVVITENRLKELVNEEKQALIHKLNESGYVRKTLREVAIHSAMLHDIIEEKSLNIADSDIEKINRLSEDIEDMLYRIQHTNG